MTSPSTPSGRTCTAHVGFGGYGDRDPRPLYCGQPIALVDGVLEHVDLEGLCTSILVATPAGRTRLRCEQKMWDHSVMHPIILGHQFEPPVIDLGHRAEGE